MTTGVTAPPSANPPLPTAREGPVAPVLYLPIEETKRELASRLLLACFAAERGISVVVGQQWLIMHNLSRMPRGLILFKGNDRIQSANMALGKRFGHMTASFEEEMFGVCSTSQILRLYEPKVADACDLFLAQGDFQRDALAQRFPSMPLRIKVVGNPRADVLRPDFLTDHEVAARAIRQRLGRYVLINTNFGTVNAAAGNTLDSYEACARQGLMDATTVEGRADFDAWCRWERLNFAAVLRFIDWFESHVPDIAIVLRPHPSENVEFWRRGLCDRARIHIEDNGVFVPWLLAADILVHTSCTTGLEAFLMRRPAVSLTPAGTRWHEHYTSNLVNPTFAEIEEAGQFVVGELAGNGRIAAMRPEFAAICDRHLATHGERLAAERTVDALAPSFGEIMPFVWEAGPDFVARRPLTSRQREKMDVQAADIETELGANARRFGRFVGLRAREIGDALFCIDLVAP